MDDLSEKSVLNCVGLGFINFQHRRSVTSREMPSRCVGILRSHTRSEALHEPQSSTQSMACIGSLTYSEPQQEVPWMFRCNGVSIEVDSISNSEPTMKSEKAVFEFNNPDEEEVPQSAIKEWACQLQAKYLEIGVRRSMQAAGAEVLGRAREIAGTAGSARELISSPSKMYDFGCSSYAQSGKIIAKMGQITQRCGMILGSLVGLSEIPKAED